MKYLYVSGCSFTWGVGLDNPPEENWGYFLGNKLEVPVRNYSYPGQGNDEIFRKLYELLYTTKSLPSIIVIQLSELTRIRIFDDIDMEWKSASVANWEFPKKTQDYYFKYYYSVYQNVYYLFTQMLLLKDKCDSLGIKFYVFDGICNINKDCLEHIQERISGAQEKDRLLGLYQAIKDKNFLLHNGDYSWKELKKDDEWYTDCHHPTEKSHEFMADELYNFIKGERAF